MSIIKIHRPDTPLTGTIVLSGSKSISNRVLIIRALCDHPFEIHNLSDSDDTKALATLLESKSEVLDAHHAGTTFRFLTSYLATRSGSHLLTGSSRMKERPIGPLVDALSSIGADIQYEEVVGFPPLRINAPSRPMEHQLSLPADISSQYISSLLLVAPTLPDGLEITLLGDIVSRPYLEMTLRIMAHFGVEHTWQGQTIIVKPQAYAARDFFVEADWSAASYYYIMAAIAEKANITLKGLSEQSLQGDSMIARIAESFGITTSYGDQQITLSKNGSVPETFFEYDFLECPDIAQSVSTMAAATGVATLFSGLQTLRIKETDRIAALQKELAKVHVYLSQLPPRFSKDSGVEYFMQEGNIESDELPPTFATYQDHRMAMAFAPLGMLFPIEIENHGVVSKSYPRYWEDLAALGFIIK